MTGKTEQPRVLPVDVGMRVEIELIAEDGSVEPMAFAVVAENAAAIEEGLLAATAPLVRALRGKAAGSTVDYRMGDIRRVRVLSVEPAAPVSGEAAERARAAVDEARRKVERTNAEIFSTAFTSKWGGYDAASLVDE